MKHLDRARVILDYLAENEVAGTPRSIHHQLVLFRGVDWKHDTTRRRLWDFQKAGYVEYRPDIGKGYYMITETGRKQKRAGLSDDALKRIVGSADRSQPD